MAKTVHLPPVRIKGLILLTLWVHKILNKVVKCNAWRIRLAAVETLDVLAEGLIVVVVPRIFEFVSEGGDETDERVPYKQEFGVVLQLCLWLTNTIHMNTVILTVLKLNQLIARQTLGL